MRGLHKIIGRLKPAEEGAGGHFRERVKLQTQQTFENKRSTGSGATENRDGSLEN